MEHLNYCRQMVKQFTNTIRDPSFPDENRKKLSHAIDLAIASKKFILPDGGAVYDDPEYRALDENEEIHLPYEFIALEFNNPKPEKFDGMIWATKTIIFARERDDNIVITPVFWIESNNIWAPLPEISIFKTHYIDRGVLVKGRISFRAVKSDPRVPSLDYATELWSLFCFLNILQCSNAHIEESKPRKAGKKTKGAIPFDTYHVLTIDIGKRDEGVSGASGGSHRSPREHLRRGHIRRLADGRRIWVNATVVAAGKGAGVVKKDYRVRGSAAMTQNAA